MMKGTNGSNFGNTLDNASKEVANETHKENLNILKDFDPTRLVVVN